jgi:hypothetical protein
MSFATVTNIATMILCIAVLIQAVRLMRALETVRGGALTEMIAALDVSTLEARRVLARLTELMRGDLATTSRTLVEGKAMVEELAIMTGIANAVAERIVDAASAASTARAVALPEPAKPEPAEPVAVAEPLPKSRSRARRAPQPETPAAPMLTLRPEPPSGPRPRDAHRARTRSRPAPVAVA